MKNDEEFIGALIFLENLGRRLGRNPKFRRLQLVKAPWSDGHARLLLEREDNTKKVKVFFEGNENLGYNPPVGTYKKVETAKDLEDSWRKKLIRSARDLGF